MADAAARNGPVHVSLRISLRVCAWMPMAIEAEPMKPSLGSFAKIRPLAPVAFDAESRTRSVCIVVVAREATDRAMLVVREIEWQPGRALKGWLAERSIDRRG
jgi:hypothetical protein